MEGEEAKARHLVVVPRMPDGPPFSDEPPPGHEADSLLHRGDHVELAQCLLGRLRETAPTVHSSGAWWQYGHESGVWSAMRQEEIDRMTTEYSGAKVNGEKKPLKIRASDVNGARKVAETLAEEPEHFDDALPGVAFTNGFLMVGDDGTRLAGHAPGHRARYSYTFPFEARETCGFRDFLASCFEGDEDAEAKIQIIREFIGACIIGKATQFQLALVLLGEGSNGKGVTMTAIEACMPPGSTVAVPPQKMTGEYYRARIAGKLLNVVSELPEADIIDSDTFKAIISGDTIEARRPTENPFSHRPIAGHIYACNRLPGTMDQSDGFWRRFVVMKYGRKFAVNSGFSEGVVSDVAATVGWALTGTPALLARKRFELPPSSADLKREWRLQSDQVAVFLDENFEPDSSGGWTKSKELYGSYKFWATENGHRPMANNKFGERMALLGFAAKKMNFGNVYYVKKKAGIEEDRPWNWRTS